ncbi:MAG: undecaprenyl-phosphate glucose phosphotransferase [Deltaproteobacteria bacterium]|nr:undecaprenyl-phosphate glucose phosphotransferase [Deltaproteobacteria bacterium]
MIKGVLREHATLVDYLSRSADPAIAVIVTLIMGRLNGFLGPSDFVWVLTICIPIFIFFIYPLFGIYKSWRGLPIWQESRALLLAWTTVLLLFHIFTLLLSDREQFAILWPFGIFKYKPFLIWAAVVYLTTAVFRALIRSFLRSIRSRGYNIRRVVIAGAGDLGRTVNYVLSSNPWLGYVIEAFFDDDLQKQGSSVAGVPVAGTLDDLPAFLGRKRIDNVFLALPLSAEKRIRELLQALDNFTGNVNMVPNIFDYYLLNCSITEIANLPVIKLRQSLNQPERLLKWLEDRVIALAALVICSPLMLLIAVAVKLSSPGPIIFKQRRYGLNGQEIVVYKFRTMTVCEDGPEIEQAKPCDPRVTRIGAVLRKYNLDELPQFINVLQGRMSVVGPRPHAVAHNEYYRTLVSYYMLRHKLKPGITGWAQVNGFRGETDTLEKMEKRIEYDLEYIDKWSLWFDLKILILTIFKGFGQPTAY